MKTIELVLDVEDFRALCGVLAIAMRKNPTVSPAIDPPTWQVFHDGTVAIDLGGTSLQNATFRLNGYTQ